MERRVELDIAGKTLKIETGKLAKQADGAALVQFGDTVVLVTACFAKDAAEDGAFFPLTVDYREFTYAAGKIPGGFFKREGKSTEKEVLTSRLIDRSIRPLFPDNYYASTQVIASVLSADQENDPDVIALCGASAALFMSRSPFNNPIAGVRVGLIDDQYVLNPTNTQMNSSRLDIIVAGTENAIVMVESSADELSEEQMLEAIRVAHEAIKKIIAGIRQLVEQEPPQKVSAAPSPLTAEFMQGFKAKYGQDILAAVNVTGKLAAHDAVDAIEKKILSEVPADDEKLLSLSEKAFYKAKEDLVRNQILDGRRTDNRAPNAIRQITIETGLLPRTHGSALFTRGETQALATVTLGTSDDAQRIEKLEGETLRRFMLNYNFPPFSVGETNPLRAPSRREIGHGALADKALRRMIPAEDKFAYTIRLVSDILESNGSSSMATVCGGTLALMDAGVPLKAPVAGVAMGLVKEGDRYAILSDIAGEEDHSGDMDFKVAGTSNGITALQMDVKIEGLSQDLMRQALEQAKEGRLYILDKMLQVLPSHREEISTYAPRLITMHIPTAKIRDVIGPGGKMIRSIIEQTGVKIDVEDDGTVTIASVDEAQARKAQEIIGNLTAEAERGKAYQGKVQRIAEYGAFVEIIPGTVGLLHVSEMAPYRVHDVRDLVTEGQEIMVRVIEIGDDGKLRLSHKEFASPTPPPGYSERQPQREYSDRPREERRDGGYRDRGGDRGRPRDGRRDSRGPRPPSSDRGPRNDQ